MPLLLAGRADGYRGYGHDGFLSGGFGAGLVGGLLGGVLFGGRRGGIFGNDGDGNGNAETRLQSNADTLAILGAINTAKDATTSGFGTTALALSQGFAGTKDAVQASTYLLSTAISNVNQNVSEQGCATRTAIQNDGDKTRTLLVARFQQEDATKIAAQAAEIIELKNEGRRNAEHAELKLQITNTNTAVAAQQQGQQQFQIQDIQRQLGFLASGLNTVLQVAHATNTNVIAGNSGAVVTGPQTANPTNVNA